LKPFALPFISGLVFALGLGISGMTQPVKVLGFLDLAGNWDPSLAFVMAGAVGAHWLVLRLGRRFLTASGSLEAAPVVVAGPGWAGVKMGFRDHRLLLGSALFGAGWGLSGLCPGPALVSLVTVRAPLLVFGIAMVGGMLLYRYAPSGWHWLRTGTPKPASQPAPVQDCGAVSR